MAAICATLYAWQQRKALGENVTDILNGATLAAVAAEEQQQSNETEQE